MSRKPFTYVSLFSGCGGFDYGFVNSSFKCLGAFDIDPIAVDTYNKNIGPFALVHDLSMGKLPYVPSEPVDIVISGSPCQGFSTAGKRRLDDPRNTLLLVGGKIAIDLKTKVFIAENVMGSVSGDHKIYWNKLEKLFRKHSYNVKFISCDATKLGIPQLRKRVLMIAYKGDIEVKFDFRTNQLKSLKDVLSGVNRLPNHNEEQLSTDSLEHKIASRIGPGQKLSNVRGGDRAVHSWDIPEVFGEITSKERSILLEIMSLRRKIRVRRVGDADPLSLDDIQSACGIDALADLQSLINKGYVRQFEDGTYDLAHTFNGKYRRLCYNRPSPTVDTRFGSAKYFLHPTEHRALTVREAARIQGFADDFIFYGPIKKQYQMVGNAVPPPLSVELAQFLKKKVLMEYE